MGVPVQMWSGQNATQLNSLILTNTHGYFSVHLRRTAFIVVGLSVTTAVMFSGLTSFFFRDSSLISMILLAVLLSPVRSARPRMMGLSLIADMRDPYMLRPTLSSHPSIIVVRYFISLSLCASSRATRASSAGRRYAASVCLDGGV